MDNTERTKWEGLWQQREGVYSSKTIRKMDIPKYAKLIIRYNKYYEKGCNKPRFVYTFAQRESANAITLKIEKDEYITLVEAEELSNMRCFTDEQLQQLINGIACAVGGESEYGEWIIDDFVEGYGKETKVY